MRMFYEEWSELDNSGDSMQIAQKSNLAPTNAKSAENEIWNLQVPNSDSIPVKGFFSIGFTQHRTIFEKITNLDERCFYISQE